jgi:hypothetical protein
MRFVGLFGGHAGAAAGSQSCSGRRPGVHAVAWLWSEADVRVHAAHLSCCGGERGSSWAEASLSTTRMVPLQSGHLGRVTAGLGSSAVSSGLVRSAELPSRLKLGVATCKYHGSRCIGSTKEIELHPAKTSSNTNNMSAMHPVGRS